LNLDIFADSISDTIKEHMEQNNLTVTEFAKQCQVSEPCVSKWLHKKTYPSLTYSVKVADYIKCSLDYLLGLTDKKEYTPALQTANFKDHLNHLVKKSGKTDSFIAQTCKFQKSNFPKWRKGVKPTPEILISLSAFFDVSIDYLVGRSDFI
jgi:transcriptional regulator, XRE family